MNLQFPGISPSHGFDEPLAVLADCHRRIEKQLTTLERLAAHLVRAGVDDGAAQAAAGVLRYFREAGMRHHEDEEADLFPVLEPVADAELCQVIARLRTDHAAMIAAWAALIPRLDEIAARRPGAAGVLDVAAVADFARLYRGHMAVEEGVLLPAAAALLTKEQVAGLGAAMAGRRGLTLE